MIFFFPFLLAAAGAIAGNFTFSALLHTDRKGGSLVLLLLIILALIAAVVPNVEQQFYNIGMSFTNIQMLVQGSYFIFAFSTVGAWKILVPSPRRWFLIILILISFAQPLLWCIVVIGWAINGFAP